MEDSVSSPPVVSFNADPLTITLGDAAVLTWQTENAESISIDNEIGAVDTSGSVTVIPTETTTYTLTATGPGGTETAQVTVTVTYIPPEVQLYADPDTIVVGESSVLTWSTDWAESCMIEPDIGVVPLNGSMTVTPEDTTTYKIVATGQGGETSAEAVVTVTDPAPTVEIAASSQTIIIGETATLTWSSQYATACSIEPNIGAVDPQGSVTVSPTETTTYTITATGSGGSATSQVNIAVEYPLPLISFSASPSSILLGQTSTLTWSSSYADTLEIDQGIGSVDQTGTYEVSPDQTTTYTLTATGPGGTSTVQVAVTVTYPMPSVELQIDPATILTGDTAVLSWNSANTVSLSIDNGIGDVAQSGSLTVSPTVSTTYTITGTGIGGHIATATATITVNTPAPIINFSANPESIILGYSAELSWSTTYTDTVTIEPDLGSVVVSGTQTVSPTQTTTYTLTATGEGGTTTESVTVTVIQPPTVTISASADTIIVGESATLTWTSDNADTCVIEPDVGTVALNGTVEVSPTETTTYTITATGPGGTETATVTITVNTPAPIVSLEADPESIVLGNSAELSWNTTYADTVTIEPDPGSVAVSGSQSVSPTETTTYTLTAIGEGGTTTESVTVTVIQPPTVTISASTDTITVGESATLTWSATNADSCSIEPGIGDVDANGTLSVSPTETTTYTITATGPGGTETATATITVNTPAPIVSFSANPESIVLGDSAELSWSTTYADTVTIEPDLGSVAVSGSQTVSPTETTTYTLTATGEGGTTTESVTVTVIQPPTVTISASADTITVGESSTLAWASDNADTCVIEPDVGTVALNGTVEVSPTETTTYTLTATGAGGTTTETTTVTVVQPSTVSLSASASTINEGDPVTLAWTSDYVDTCVIEPDVGTVALNGTVEVYPAETTTYVITATGIGGIATATVEIVVQPVSNAPVVNLEPVEVSIEQGESATLTWTSSGAESAYIDNGVGSVSISDSVSVSPENTTIYTLTVSGPNGSTSAQAVVHVTAYTEPQSEGTFGHLYNDQIPADATIEEYDENRFAMIVGAVQDVDGQAIEGVMISIHSHPEYGTATTDANGQFALPAEGGAWLTVVYRKQGIITSHRQVYVPWNDFAIAETITLIEEDPVTTTVTFDGDPETIVVHRSSDLTDEFGTRSTTMVFAGDNQAYLTDENGNAVQSLDTITTRATTYPTPESMPAVLPPNSGFTFCTEMAVDGAQRVVFSKPVITWVENYLGFDVGEVVPVGYYDRDRGVWVPSDNGVVVRLLDTDGDGIVDALDADGDDQPDDLTGDGEFLDEVTGLSDPAEYEPGTTYWRVEVTHFTPWDCNWPYGPPEDATAPNPIVAPELDQAKPEEQDCKGKFNSYVEERSRVFHEDIPIPGTDITLHYSSNRVQGQKYIINVPASGETVPESLKRIIVKAEIAGRTYEHNLDPLPNQQTEFLWNGLDYFGNKVSFINAYISIGYVYDSVYLTGSDYLQAFARAGRYVTGIRGEQEAISWKKDVIEVISSLKSNDIIAEGWTLSNHHQFYEDDYLSVFIKGDGSYSKPISKIIDTLAGTGIRGYSGDGGIAVNARLDCPEGLATDAIGNLYIADTYNNCIRKVDANGIITTVAGTGSYGYSGDGGPAVQAELNEPMDVVVDAIGNLYISDSENHCIRMVDKDGIITTVAGTGSPGYGGDGGLAVETNIDYPNGVEVDFAGNLYIATGYRICKVDANGIITTVAGTGSQGYSGDGGFAIETDIGYPGDLVVDFAGNLYITDGNNACIRKVDTSGIITTFAGTGIHAYDGDGGPATEANLSNPMDVTLDSSGNLYIIDVYANLVRKVNTSGIITTIAGIDSVIGGYSGDGGPAVQAEFYQPHAITIDATGNLFITDYGNQRIRAIKIQGQGLFANAMTDGQRAFSEENGVAHVIDANDLHVSTIDLDTGVALYEFSYDEEDNLVTITDQFGNQTTLERSSDGVPTAIISPDGLRTELTIDSDNRLVQIAYPDGSDYDFEYTTDGLLIDKIDPNENHFPNEYDDNGRLVSIGDDEGGLWQYFRTIEDDGDILVEKLSAEGNLSSYLDHTDTTGAYTSVITSPNGDQTHYSRSADGLTAQKTFSCGMSLAMQYDLDSVYKYVYLRQLTETTPASLEKVSLNEKTYADTDSDGLPDQFTETYTMNGKATTLLTDILQSAKTVTSPEGREATANYDANTLLTTSLIIPGLYDKTYGYNSKGRITSITMDTRQTTFSYDSQGNLASITDPEDYTTSYGYDAVGRVTSVDRPDGSSLAFTYDFKGNMTILTNPVDVEHEFNFNKINLPSGYNTPVSGNYSYIYDYDRRLIQTNFPSGKQINNVYTADQLTQIQTPEGNIDLTYSCSNKVESITNGSETIEYAYDGKLFTDVTLSGTLNQSLSYVYNNDFDITQMTYAGGAEALSYDLDGLLTVSGDFTITRNTDNGLPESVSGNGLFISRAFNGYSELQEQSVTVNSQAVAQWSLTRNNGGRITSKTETVGGETHSYEYSYDPLGRLATVTLDGVIVEEYGYDLSGTRIIETNSLRGIINRSLSYSDEDHLLTAGDADYTYDLDGFLTSKTEFGQTTTYSYSTRGELLQVLLPDGRIVSYDHDPLGRRIVKRIDGTIVAKYLWQGLTNLLAVYDGSDNLIQRFEYADGRMPVAMTQGGSTYFLAYDQVGSLRGVVDASGSVVKQIDYDSFGNILNDSNSPFSVPIGFAGGFHDRDTGLVRFGYRDYDPDTGRWTAKDPIRFFGGDTDLYGYCFNDPINFIDPMGLEGLWEMIKKWYTRADVTDDVRNATELNKNLKKLDEKSNNYASLIDELAAVSMDPTATNACEIVDEAVEAQKEMIRQAGTTTRVGGHQAGTVTGKLSGVGF